MDVNIDDIRLVPPLSVLTLALAQFSEIRDKSNGIKYLWPRRLFFLSIEPIFHRTDHVLVDNFNKNRQQGALLSD